MGQITELVALVSEINTANGWRENTGEVLTHQHPVAQIAALSFLYEATADAIECVRKGGTWENQLALLAEIYRQAGFLRNGLPLRAADALTSTGEYDRPVHGSRIQAIARLRLIDTETAEATEAVRKGDVDNLAEELADIVIRVLDFVGAWNDAHPDSPIDLEGAIIAKLERNKTRGYRHGGKRA